MTTQGSRATRRSLFASLILIAVLGMAALIFRGPLAAWFGGGPLGTSLGAPVKAQLGAYSLEARLEPDPPVQTGQSLLLVVRDAAGKPVEGLSVELAYDMPAMGAMPEMKGNAAIESAGPGGYRARFDLPMAGSWSLIASVSSKGESFSQRFAMTVGSQGLSVAGAASEAFESGSSDAIEYYTCTMHPSVHQHAPGKCPICGMELVPVSKKQRSEGVVTIDERRRQLIGVRTAKVVEGELKRAFSAVGRVTYDESALSDVTLRVRGFITRLSVTRTGQRVERGQMLFQLYSPELYAAQRDFLIASRSAGSSGEAHDAGPVPLSFANAARKRLYLLGMTEAQIDSVLASGEPLENVPVFSPAGGFVIEKNVVDGAAVEAGMRLYRIAALGKVWVEADVYEADLPHVHVGDRAEVTLDYVPGRAYDAKVSYVYPYLESQARTGKVRLELANRELELKPGMYARVSLERDVGSRVLVPAPAVVYTGPRRLVFVDEGDGRFRPQEVRLGSEADGQYEVLDGLAPGDVVAVSGVFLIAAEARIGTAAKYWEAEPPDAGMGAGMPEGGMP